MLRGESDREKIREIQALAREIIRLNGGRDIRFVPEDTERVTDGFVPGLTPTERVTDEFAPELTPTERVTDDKENRTSNTRGH